MMRVIFKLMIKSRIFARPALAIKHNFFIQNSVKRSLISQYPVLVYSTYLQFNSEAAPRILTVKEFLESENRFSQDDRIVLTCTYEEFKEDEIIEILENHTPRVTHCIQSSLASVDAINRIFLTPQENHSFHVSRLEKSND